jgi:predicted acylesterase/phospholipase RssA
MTLEQSLPGFDDRSPRDRYCDLVLTGGVTSSIAYPGVIHGLAQAYRFNAIGGSSSGAGAAALAAAAEYRRRHGSADGFRTLLRRTSEIADEFQGRTGLYWLFQPEPHSRRLFKFLLPIFAGPKQRVGHTFKNLLKTYWHSLVLGALLGAAIPAMLGTRLCGLAAAGWYGLAVATGFLAALALCLWQLWRDIRQLPQADYGLCSGQYGAPDAPHAPLTAWLHHLIQDVAGLPAERPLTFADLWSAPGGPRETLADMSPAGARSIDLRMFTANASLGRPLLLPQADDEPTLYFRPGEMRRLFPAAVVDFMMRQGGVYDGPAKVEEPSRNGPPLGADEGFWTLPRRELPVLVAARMSVSFPVLFSAVPLWTSCRAGTRFRRLLFVDGGLCSGFPIHLFDSPIPAWPTFGVALHEIDEKGRSRPLPEDCVKLPQSHAEAPFDRWRAFDQADTPLARLLGFGAAMFTTIKDWHDAQQAELPGVRERVAQIELPGGIGGLNILMEPDAIRWLGRAGGEAARQFLRRYAAPDQGNAQASGWREHRWVRFNVLAECLQESLVGLSRAARFARHATPLNEQIRDAINTPALAGEDDAALRPDQAAALERTLDALLQIERALTPRTAEQPYRPVPRPQLRIRPPM